MKNEKKEKLYKNKGGDRVKPFESPFFHFLFPLLQAHHPRPLTLGKHFSWYTALPNTFCVSTKQCRLCSF